MSADDPVSPESGQGEALDPAIREEFVRLKDRIKDLEAGQDELRRKYNSLAGLADDEESTPAARARDVKQLMQSEAENRTDVNGYLEWDYNDVLSHLASNGHGELDPKQAYRTMERVGGKFDGFAYDDDSDPTKLRFSKVAVQAKAGFDTVNNENGDRPSENGRDPPLEHNSG